MGGAAGFGIIASEQWSCFTAGMPERDNLEKFPADTVVSEIANSSEVQPANYVRARCFNLGANAGFFNEQGQGSL